MGRMEKSSHEEMESKDQLSDPDEKQGSEETKPWRPLTENEPVNHDLSETMPVQTAVHEEAQPGEPIAEAPPALIGNTHHVPPSEKGYEETSAIAVSSETDPTLQSATQPTLISAKPDQLSKGQPTPTAKAGGIQGPPKAPARKIKQSGRRGLPWFFFPLLGAAILLFVLMLSAFGGYEAGIGQRKQAERTQVAQAAAEQFQLGLQDMGQGAYARARQRFEYVIQLDPGYPGASEKLAEVLLELNTTATPTLLPTASLTPTADMRDAEQMFGKAQQALAASDWTTAIDEMLALRKADPGFRTVEIDGMLFLALRNRGRDQILKESDLESGIYDLTLASKFGPLDAEAQGLLSWSSLYITGASFWGIDWEQAVNYFSQVAPQLPNLMDGSKMTATERLRIALFEYGNTLAARGQYCKAVKAYQDSLAIAPDASVQQAGELAAKGCSGEEQAPAGTQKPGKNKKSTPIP